jgi:hypothetical protein
MVDSCSELHEDQESTKIFGVCVEKLKNRRERKMEGNGKF